MSPRKNIFVFGLDDLHRRQLESLPRADEYRFHTLVPREELRSSAAIDAERLLERTDARLRGFAGSIDAVVGFWDFPVSTLLPIVRRRAGCPTVSLEAVLRCEHKYWSRLEQQRCIPEQVPAFQALDPFARDVRDRIELPYPFWIKPVKSVLSHLGFRVHDDAELDDVIERMRRGIHVFGDPFDQVLAHARLPEEIARVGGNHCILEAIISQGRQCTLEGYALGGEIVVYGAVDSIREGRHRSSFARYQYPSSLPPDVIERMTQITQSFIAQIGFDGSPFNVEFYWDEEQDRIWLLEVNPRISKSHCPLFEKVDGEAHHQVMIDVALGERPEPPHREGEWAMAAKFMWRHHGDAVVRHVPSSEESKSLREAVPGVEIELAVEEGTRLSELPFQDSYSYELATIFVGGDDEQDLLEKYEACRQALPLELEPV